MRRWNVTETGDGIELTLDGKTLFRHTRRRSWIAAGKGEAEYRMYRGNFSTTDSISERRALTGWELRDSGESASIRFSCKGGCGVTVRVSMERGPRVGPEDAGAAPGVPPTGAPASGMAGPTGGHAQAAAPATGGAGPESLMLEFLDATPGFNRWRFRLHAESGERAWGCGEQFSHFNLRGRTFPLWTSEQGVGRNRRNRITRIADAADGSGGDYWWTFYPQPSFVTERRLRVHMETSAWAEFDFRPADSFVLSVRDLPRRLVFGSAGSFAELARENARYFGLQPEPPSWVHDGVILGIQGGTETCLSKLRTAQDAGVPVAGIWAQDWEGIRHTSFGKRLAWNWKVEPGLYPDLASTCARLKMEGIRFLAYANCYLACDKPLFAEAERLGILVKDKSGGTYRFDAGEFDAAIPDLTNPAGREWFKSVLKDNLLGLGISGWMADFGEYMPVDCVLHDGTPAETAHNLWPVLWARVNREAVEEAGAAREATYFMRAGYSGSHRWCPMMWAGDQNVDWSMDDGLPSVIPAALSLAMLGHGFHHSDLGGYTTLFGMHRTKELFLRWAELSAFTVMMRTHEGNRPSENHQFDSDPGTLAGLARMGRLRVALTPYFRSLAAECSTLGTPLMRPLFMVDESDQESYNVQDQFVLGDDLVVAPVLAKGSRKRRLRLPHGDWVHLWSGEKFTGPAWIDMPAPLGEPPAFYRVDSEWAEAFRTARDAARRIV